MRYLDVDTSKRISRIGLGTWQFGATEWGYGQQYSDRVAHAIVRRALELGVTLFDTAEIYAHGRSERILGDALGEDAESVFLATKMFPVVPGAFVVRQRAAASMKRLGVSRLDLYQVHWPNPMVSDGTIMRGMTALQRAGLIGDVGVSNYSLPRWRVAESALGGRVLSNQVSYSLVARAPERELLPFAEAHDRVLIAYSPLAQGLLSGKFDRESRPTDSVRVASPNFYTDNLDRAGDLIGTLREVADAHSATPAQIALAWVIHHPAVAAIPGASSVEQLESNAAAAEIQLSDDEYQALNMASARFSPAVVANVSPSAKFALKHSVKGGRHVAKTIWNDYRRVRIPAGDARTKKQSNG
jgi:aryl-alcohol dehydrogenase-like predicted oxidoreductase